MCVYVAREPAGVEIAYDLVTPPSVGAPEVSQDIGSEKQVFGSCKPVHDGHDLVTLLMSALPMWGSAATG
ncbi:hypothetical protein DCC24_05600 [Auritidibacter sp. NML100628]|nr:hypothetical protein DCC24_05600 [Auritidibacter sp. NML100628]